MKDNWEEGNDNGFGGGTLYMLFLLMIRRWVSPNEYENDDDDNEYNEDDKDTQNDNPIDEYDTTYLLSTKEKSTFKLN
jgi:hypothetical protein